MVAGPVRYIGRFAPSPTGPLHAGSLVAALASWLDARAHGPGARWLVRIEDLDRERCVPGATDQIMRQLHALDLLPDEAPLVQSKRLEHYDNAIAGLKAAGMLYRCGCSRKDVLAARARLGLERTRHGELVYPGTCRDQLHASAGVSLRLRCDLTPGYSEGWTTRWTDRRLGPQAQDVAREVGDFVLLRADGVPSYQLAVVVDDAAQEVTDVVRGEDLADNT
ncbi:MAG: tRNA glutamyl-Q(34) synthetase GluQRS, partial [Rhodoferax sp.]|nr:tRNA glutamyl-Q(34) synthetase GluQRS [Rhodoferax sp.]